MSKRGRPVSKLAVMWEVDPYKTTEQIAESTTEHEGDIAAMALDFGVDQSTLYRFLRKHDLFEKTRHTGLLAKLRTFERT